MGQWLRELAALAQDLGSFPSTHWQLCLHFILIKQDDLGCKEVVGAPDNMAE